ncbi:hypothetical protein DEU56DRAFT_842537 [Suillus clintonianus]|uniref:uncharacterized protein n=1 Tax=Suillus clintonianus TaxID=1904413 RepID=UPI001B86D8A4|nr:uncharacterized protein DEU56DRAFT_842537 [Suillus clintonianus]KAG2112851.1 hypothetical protein DEU56DRAFT_842537 [Suillus clintonianus]
MSDAPSRNTRKTRSVSLHIPKQCDPTPVPPSLANSPHLSSPYSVFRRKPAILTTPSQEDDEWLRDMVPLNREQDTFDEKLLSAVSLPATSVQKQWESSREDPSPSSSGGSLSPRPSLHRSWSTPSTPSMVAIADQDTRRRV